MWDVYESSQSGSGGHVRVHPLLHLTELDVWRYTKRENLPVVDLYFNRGGRDARFRSLGCKSCCSPIESGADSIDAIIAELDRATTPERAGRAQDKESAHLMQKLRTLGYM
jgi:sulfate adenylyltransferase subunit 2